MGLIEKYLDAVTKILREISIGESANIEKAAQLLADSVADDHLVYVLPVGGHSFLLAEEMFYRAGGLAAVSAILDAGVSLIHGATRTTAIERTVGYAKSVLNAYGIGKGDVVIVPSAPGVHAVAIDAALELRERGAKVIAITSSEFSKSVPPDHPVRHPSRKNLFEVADVVVDMHVPPGDAVVEVERFAQKVAPVSTIVGAFIINSIVARTVENLVERGIKPPVWMSANMPGGNEVNKRLVEKYRPRVKHL